MLPSYKEKNVTHPHHILREAHPEFFELTIWAQGQIPAQDQIPPALLRVSFNSLLLI